MNVSKKALKKLVEKPSLLGKNGCRDKYTQEGIVMLAKHLLDNDGKITLWEIER